MDVLDDMIRDAKNFGKILDFVQGSVNEAISELNNTERANWFKEIDLNAKTIDKQFKDLIGQKQETFRKMKDTSSR